MAAFSARFTYANVVATMALFIALGGSSYAAVQLSAGSVQSRHIKNGQVKTADLANGAVTTAKVADGSLLGADFARGQLLAGPQGPRGLPGAGGVQGDAGATGLTGAKGDKGDEGDACLASDPACRGPQGDTGPAGPGGKATAVFRNNVADPTIGAAIVSVIDLKALNGQGGGRELVLTAPGLILATANLDVRRFANGTQASSVACSLSLSSDNTTYRVMGNPGGVRGHVPLTTDVNVPPSTLIALTGSSTATGAAAAVPAGTYDVRVACGLTGGPGTDIRLQQANLVVWSVPV